MKKIVCLIITITLFVITACGGPYSSATSELYVVEKGYSKDYKESWIIAFNPNDKTEKEKIKIMIEDPMVWNLIEVNQSYFTSYSKKGDKPWILEQIENIGDEDTLR